MAASKNKALTPERFRSMCRGHTETVVKRIVAYACSDDVPPSVSLAACQELLSRGWGKPTQPHSGDDEKPIIHEIRWRVVGS